MTTDTKWIIGTLVVVAGLLSAQIGAQFGAVNARIDGMIQAVNLRIDDLRDQDFPFPGGGRQYHSAPEADHPPAWHFSKAL